MEAVNVDRGGQQEGGVVKEATQVQKEARRQEDQEVRRQEEQVARSRGTKEIVEVWLARAQRPAAGLEADLKKAAEKIKQLEHVLKEEKKISEIFKQEHITQTETQEKVIMMMATEIRNLQEGKESQLADGKDKALKETLDKLTMAEKEKKELTEKLEETTKEKEELKETVNTLKKVVESVGKDIDEKEKNKTQKKIMCWNISKTAGCKWGQKCKFGHEEEGLVKKTECAFWLDGQCRFSEKDCWNNHDPSKKGSKSQNASQSDFHAGQEERRLPPGLVISETSASGPDVQGWEKPTSRKTKRKMRATVQEESQSPAYPSQKEQSGQPMMNGAGTSTCPLTGGPNQTTQTSPLAGESIVNPQQMLLLALQALVQQAGRSL